jgi:hypothetical protein
MRGVVLTHGYLPPPPFFGSAWWFGLHPIADFDGKFKISRHAPRAFNPTPPISISEIYDRRYCEFYPSGMACAGATRRPFRSASVLSRLINGIFRANRLRLGDPRVHGLSDCRDVTATETDNLGVGTWSFGIGESIVAALRTLCDPVENGDHALSPG